jgi:SH3-like domain-containing protein
MTSAHPSCKAPVLALATGAALALPWASGPVAAQTRETPYWATIDTTELNMRVGPGRDYRIDWVYEREGLPLKVLRVQEGWRFVQDPDGTRGWVAAALIRDKRPGAYVVGEGLAAMRESPADNAGLRWNLEPGVVGALGPCDAGWCELSVGRRTGFVRQDRLWGAGEP